MRIGTSLHAITEFGNDVVPFHQAVADAADCGFASLMLLNFPGQPALVAGERPGCSLLDLEASDPALVRQALAEAGLAIACVYQGFMNVADDEAATASAGTLSRLVALAGRLGASTVIPNAGAAPAALTPTAEKEELLQRLARVLMMGLEAAPPDMRIAIDIHYGAAVEGVADCRRLFELAQDDRAGITLNIGHMTTCRQEGWVLAKERPDRIHVVAWKDHLLQPPPEATHPVYSVELGTGDSPFEKYVEALRGVEDTKEHLITFEHIPLPGKKGALRRSLVYLKGLWAA